MPGFAGGLPALTDRPHWMYMGAQPKNARGCVWEAHRKSEKSRNDAGQPTNHPPTQPTNQPTNQETTKTETKTTEAETETTETETDTTEAATETTET